MKVSVRFQLYSRPNADGACPILLRVSYAGLRVDVRSGCVIEPEKWDKALGCVRSGVKNCFRQTSGEINRRLLELSTLAEEVACNFEREANRAPNAEEFKNAFDVAAGRKEETAARPSLMSSTNLCAKLAQAGRTLPPLSSVRCARTCTPIITNYPLAILQNTT